ncbi:MAG: acyl-ACP--UDP-N-acetylglucosamine O-acyltransferase [Bacteroidota bacterium]
MSAIHPLASVHPEAIIGENVTIEPFAYIQKDVVIGDGCWIGPHTTIMDGVRMQNHCRVFPGAVVGAIPQDLKFSGEYSLLEIGNYVTIREYCTVNRGTKAAHRTVIGDYSLLMAYVHVAHDCLLGKNTILANNVNLAGHIEIGDFAILGGGSAVHQFVKIGDHSFIGGGSLVRKDVPPFVKAAREPLSYAGVNSVGLRRRGFNGDTINEIQDIYRLLFVNGKVNTSQAIRRIESDWESSPERDKIIHFLKDSKRGLMKGFKHLNGHQTRKSG